MCSGSASATNTTLVYITYTVTTVPGSFWLNGQLRMGFGEYHIRLCVLML
jgi:hypothetical protein